MSPDFRAEPDFETMAVQWLAGRSNVTALVPATAIGTKLRQGWKAGDPAIRIRRIGGLPVDSRAKALRRARLQVEAFAGEELDAFAIIAVAELELGRMPTGTFTGATITATAIDLPIANLPDPDSDSARYLFGTVLYGRSTAT